jgi:Na+-translocating ferredoxin:NAD+ oxidoreductase RnfA subunit
MKFLVMQLLHPCLTSSFLGLSILLFSDSLSSCSSFKVRDQVLHPCKTREKIIVFYILIIMFQDFELMISKHSPELICSQFIHECNFDLLN